EGVPRHDVGRPRDLALSGIRGASGARAAGRAALRRAPALGAAVLRHPTDRRAHAHPLTGMDFRFDDEQAAFRDAIRACCAQHFPLDAVAARDGVATAPETWRALAEMGVFGLLLPGEPGGAVEAAIAFEQFGAHLATGPRLWSTIAAPLGPDVVAGDVRVTG